MSDFDRIRVEAERLRITRLCHFTPTRNLVHIATGEGVWATEQLSDSERSEFNQQDLLRLDRHPGHISCSIEYPNAYYRANRQRQARGEELVFRDWVCLYIAPTHLWDPETLLCAHNAAGFSGANVASGFETFQAMYADVVRSPQRAWRRAQHPDPYPTDAQAEVLVKRFIPIRDILAMAVRDEDQARNTHAILDQLLSPLADVPLVLVPDYWQPNRLAVNLSRGVRPVERTWHAEQDERQHEGPG
jgi:hypothetical protein